MRTYTYSLLSLVFVVFVSLNTARSGNPKGDPDPGVGTYSRDGNTIYYKWNYTDIGGQVYNLSFSLDFKRGWDYMQSIYSNSNHNMAANNVSIFFWNDPFKVDLTVLAAEIRRLARQNGLNEIELALSFVQALPYDDNNHQIQRYAVETLIDCTGDCSDTAVLYGGILQAWNYDFIFLWFPDHIAVGVWLVPIYGTYYTFRGRDYYFAESTGTGFRLGECPTEHKGEWATFESPWR